MKIALVNPPCSLRQKHRVEQFSPTLPLGIAYLGAVLEADGHTVRLIDSIAEGRETREFENGMWTIGLPISDILSRIREFDPDLVGISCLFSSRRQNMLKVARAVKQFDPDLKVVTGGIDATLLAHEHLQSEYIDFVSIGESEDTLRLLVRLMEHKIEKQYFCLDGFGYKDGDVIKINPKTKFIENLDLLPFPARHLLPMHEYFKAERYRRQNNKYSVRNVQRNSVITSRGCSSNCSFCSIHATWGTKWRPRSPENVLAEIHELVSRYKAYEISFDDDNLTLSKKRMMRICSLIRHEGLEIKWDTPNGVCIKTLDQELLRAMKRSGCCTLNLPIEHADQNILHREIGKHHSISKVRQVTKICRKLGIKTLGYFVIGMIGETPATIRKSAKFAVSLKLDELNVFIATPYPETGFYRKCVEKGYINKYDVEAFAADDDMQQTPIVHLPALSPQELVEQRQWFYDTFNTAQ